jgi:diguanylate cyclase (GGDEF)-like protein/PAS domain S-box-containing protein
MIAPSDILLDSLTEVVFQTDPRGNWTYLNQAWTRVFGYRVEETLGKNFLEYVHPDERAATIQLFQSVVTGKLSYCHHEGRYQSAGGGYRWIELRANVSYDESGEMVGNSGTLFDITDRHEAQEILKDEVAILELIAQDAPLHETMGSLAGLLAGHSGMTVTAVTHPQAQRRSAGRRPAATPALGLVPDTHVSGNGTIAVARPGGSSASAISASLAGEALITSLAEAERLPGRNEFPIRSHHSQAELGRIVLYQEVPRALGKAVMQVIERCTRLSAIAINRSHTEETIRRQALEDPLTGLPNRALLHDRFEQALVAARRYGGSVGLVLYDLDRFKDINDTLGHEVGDLMLRHVATQLQGAMRPGDTVGRLGGDEFVLLMPGLQDPDEAVGVARTALDSLEQPLQLEEALLKPKASVGIALYPTHANDPAGVLRRADVAMYRVKRLGGQIAVYDPALDQEELDSLGFVAELQRAIETDQLLVNYQPKISLRTGHAAGAECLVRWHHPVRGIISPAQFIPLAESTGLIKPLSIWVIRRALQDCRSWHERGYDVTVAVNLSAPLLYDPELFDTIEREMRASRLPPGRLELEITESAVMQDPERAMTTIRRLRGLGVTFALDDFGTGYSSLASLKNLPVQSIKIDQSFVRDMVTDERDASIVRAAIELGHTFKLDIVAEGVESQNVRELLKGLECDYVQGFHLARPMPAPAFFNWHTTHVAH